MKEIQDEPYQIILDRFQLYRLGYVIKDEDSNFEQLTKIAGLDKNFDFRGMNLDSVDFEDSDLSGFDFTKCSMRHCDFSKANVKQTIFDAADLAHSVIADHQFSQFKSVFHRYDTMSVSNTNRVIDFVDWKHIALALEYLRQDMGLSRSGMSTLVGVSVSTLNRFIRGENVQIDTVLRIGMGLKSISQSLGVGTEGRRRAENLSVTMTENANLYPIRNLLKDKEQKEFFFGE